MSHNIHFLSTHFAGASIPGSMSSPEARMRVWRLRVGCHRQVWPKQQWPRTAERRDRSGERFAHASDTCYHQGQPRGSRIRGIMKFRCIPWHVPREVGTWRHLQEFHVHRSESPSYAQALLDFYVVTQRPDGRATRFLREHSIPKCPMLTLHIPMSGGLRI